MRVRLTTKLEIHQSGVGYRVKRKVRLRLKYEIGGCNMGGEAYWYCTGHVTCMSMNSEQKFYDDGD
jgi:hypothetical protein